MRAARDALAARLFFLVVLSLPKRWFFSYNFLDTATSLGAITNIELASEKLRSGRAHSNRVLSRTIGELAWKPGFGKPQVQRLTGHYPKVQIYIRIGL